MTDAQPVDVEQQPNGDRWPRRLAWFLSLSFLLGLAIRLSVHDRYLYLSTVFYALPLPVLTALAIVTAGLFRRLSDRRAFRVWGLTAVGMSLWCVAASFGWHRPDDRAGESLRILCWNTCRGELGWNRVAAFVNEIQPDVAGLVEAGEADDDRRSFWTEACPGYHVAMLGGGMVCLTKGTAGDGMAVGLPGRGEYRRLDVTVRGQTVTLLIVDLQSNPLHSRQATLERLADDAGELLDRPVVILGDFNTPADSVHFRRLRSGYRHAFEAAGQGYMATWPVPLPVLCLDHIWANDRVRVDHCTHRWTIVSDHRPVVADVRVVR